MIKESTCNGTENSIIYLTEKEIENIFWYHKCHKKDIYELILIPTGIGEAKKIRESGNTNTEYNITDYTAW